jgi:hypothetical protein
MKSFLASLKTQKEEQRRAEIQKSLLHYEARLGGELFGPIPEGRRREFFCLDKHTWVWHEEWNDDSGQRKSVTTRYDVRPNEVLKSQGTNSYQRLMGLEARNFYNAADLYEQRVTSELQRLLQAA